MSDLDINVEMQQLREKQARMAEAAKNLFGRHFYDAMGRATLLVMRSAQEAAPVDTGRLRGSITPTVEMRAKEMLGVVGSNVIYAPFVEYGTRPHWPPPGALATWARRHGVPEFVIARAIARYGTKPQPYLGPALDDNWREIQEILMEGLIKGMSF